jgi:hypothetical protein
MTRSQHLVKRAVALVAASLSVAACVSSSTTRVQAPEPGTTTGLCAAPLQPYLKATLYMGRGTQDAAEWQAFVDEVLVRHFPDGGSMVEVSGWWEGRVGDAAEKNSRMLVMLHPAGERQTFVAGIEAVIADIKARFGHRAVLWEETSTCALLSS